MRILLSILLALFHITAFAQIVAIQDDGYPNNLYIGLKNYLTIAAENCPCNTLRITCSDGKISGSKCRYVYNSDTATAYLNLEHRFTEFRIYKKVGKKSIFLRNIFYQLKFVPDPIAIAGSYNSGDTVKCLREIWSSNFTLLRSEVPGIFPLHISFYVKKFKISIIRGDSIVVNDLENTGNWYSNEVKEVFKNLKNGDKVNFYDIDVKGTDGTYRRIKPIQIIILNKTPACS